MAFDFPSTPYQLEASASSPDLYSPSAPYSREIPGYGFIQSLNTGAINSAQLQNAVWRIDSSAGQQQPPADFQIRTDGSLVDLRTPQRDSSKPLVLDFSFNPEQAGSLSDKQQQAFLGMLAAVRQHDGAQWQPANLPSQLQQLLQQSGELLVPPYQYPPQPAYARQQQLPAAPEAYAPPAAGNYPVVPPFFPPQLQQMIRSRMANAQNVYNEAYDTGAAVYNNTMGYARNVGRRVVGAGQYIGSQVYQTAENLGNTIAVNWPEWLSQQGVTAVAQDVRQGLAKLGGWSNEAAMPVAGAVHGITPEIIKYVNEAYEKTGCLPAVALAHFMLESGGGQHMPEGSCNPFGMKWTPRSPFGYVEANTAEEGPNGMYNIDARFVKYPSMRDAFMDHARLLMRPDGPYADALPYLKNGDLNSYIDIIAKHYGTDSAYAEKLKTMMTELAHKGYFNGSKPTVAQDAKGEDKTASAKDSKTDGKADGDKPTEQKTAAGGDNTAGKAEPKAA
jgi:hypothetical protein